MKKVEFKIGKDTLRGSLFIPKGKGPFPSVIFLHGSGGVGETYFAIAEKLSKKGILGFAFNYRGAGVSDGKFEDQTIAMGIEDAMFAFKFLQSQEEVDRKRIGICGGSLGGFIAGVLSTTLNPKSIVLSAPASYSPLIVSSVQRDSDDLRKDWDESDSYKNIASFRGSLLVIKCELDDVLPAGMVEKYAEAAVSSSRKEEFLLKGAKHRISIQPQPRKILIAKIIEWFKETL